jgi:hypothetical protein
MAVLQKNPDTGSSLTKQPSRLGGLGIFRPDLDRIYSLVFVVAGWRSGLAPICDNSFLCHLRTGRWIIENGIPRADMFSFTAAGRLWVAESWLADLIYGIVDRFFGLSGLTALTAATCAAIAGLWYRLALRLCGDRRNAAIITALSLGTSWTVWAPRPLLAGLLCFLLLVWMVESNARGWALAATAPLMWIWANLHGSFMLGFAYLGLHLAGEWAEGNPPWAGRERELALSALAGFALCFLNPYGAGLIAEPFHLLAHRSVLGHVIEWRPARPDSVQALMYLAWLTALAVCFAIGTREHIVRDLVVSLPFVALGVWAFRNIAVAPVVTMPVAARLIASRREVRDDTRPLVGTALAAVVAALAVFWTIRAAPGLDFSGFPVDAMRAVDAHGLLGKRLLSTDKWGDYIIYRYWPRQRVFVDDRYNLYPVQIVTDMLTLLNGSDDWHAILERYRIDVVVWPAERPAVEALEREPDWSRVFRDGQAIVYMRSTGKQASQSINLGGGERRRGDGSVSGG